MLVLTRREGEAIRIGDNVTITILRDGNQIRLGIDAPADVSIKRGEMVGMPKPPRKPPPDPPRRRWGRSFATASPRELPATPAVPVGKSE